MFTVCLKAKKTMHLKTGTFVHGLPIPFPRYIFNVCFTWVIE